MKTKAVERTFPPTDLPVVDRSFVDETIQRVTGAELITGNDVRLLVDATENYPEWLAAIAAAKQRIFFESYIIHEDEQGELFADALIDRASDGVAVKLIYDWMGGFGKTSRQFWQRLRDAGIEVRCFNPPSLWDPLEIVCRDHRKTMVVDGEIAFVSGLCVGQDWIGHPDQDIPPWRDTGVKLAGPAVAEVEAAFADVWKTMGSALDTETLSKREELADAGGTALRVVKSVPGSSYIYRLDQLLAVTARETMWITDAYFVGVPSYIQTLIDSSRDGVDVRILVPQSTDIGLIGDTTRSTYRSMLEAGVRVYEWNGPMMHAKTAVFDGRFARVGSTNLNIASWFGNYELDILVEEESFAEEMEEMFLRDIANATEIVISETAPTKRKKLPRRLRRKSGGSMRKATAGALNAATSIGAAIANRAPLGAAESRLLFIAGSVLLGLALLLIFFPRVSSIPLIVILLILAIPTLVKAIKNYRTY